MVTREDLQEKYANLPNEKLLEIIDRKFDYTELAILVAIEELGKRNVSEKEITNYKDEKIKTVHSFIRKNIAYDLSIVQKNLFYFIWFPLLNYAFKMNFRDDGYVLKLQQANYYSLLGFIFFMIDSGICGSQGFSILIFIALWIVGFLVTYAFDEYFNRQRQIKRINKMFNPGNQDDSEE